MPILSPSRSFPLYRRSLIECIGDEGREQLVDAPDGGGFSLAGARVVVGKLPATSAADDEDNVLFRLHRVGLFRLHRVERLLHRVGRLERLAHVSTHHRCLFCAPGQAVLGPFETKSYL